jgi:hypothetical protein
MLEDWVRHQRTPIGCEIMKTMRDLEEGWSFQYPLTPDDEKRLRSAGKDLSALIPDETCDSEEYETKLK